MKENAEDLARGRWRSVLTALDVDASLLTGKHQACPVCGGKDRFRFNHRSEKGLWICNACGGGDGIQLLQHVHGWDFRRAADAVREVCGAQEMPRDEVRASSTPEQLKKAMNELWTASNPVKAGDATDLYLRARGFADVAVHDIRNCAECPVRTEVGLEKLPAMVALIRGLDGKPVSLHKTFLGYRKKADIESPRRFQSEVTVPPGAAVRLLPFEEGSEIGVAEGIETALAAALIFKVPVWAALTAGGLATWEPPASASKVWIFGDEDSSFTGQWRMYELAHKLRTKKVNVEPIAPKVTGHDWADVWVEMQKVARAEAAEDMGVSA